MENNELQITDNTAENRFEAEIDGKLAILEYKLIPDSIYLVHTEVPDELGGRGIARRLAVHGLDYARKNGLLVNPVCPYVAAYLKKHRAEYEDLLSPKSIERIFGQTADN